MGLDVNENIGWNRLSNNIDNDLSESESDSSIDAGDIPERTQSAPMTKTRRYRNFRPKSCFPIICN